ncbi:NAD(P)/FAD-dependent oxidoreductase [Singulisphaera acidiphila]|uniref:Flavin-dependent dehydrogenase n=1 Tax=Singulisphaera acidiphila (strain ATCC BAA-1392 / DSM 18658 / VKM B-2454 / MOB10) TaxID=886293 RepID=L0DPE7_SINAD|nr:NAD(P)/FAD-dependent oxidoreductase [Singulisphaera acidiphila]AGA31132.1 flavin-dependent dehydrogenase [Singulisphaera acidiphila DSM 18658]
MPFDISQPFDVIIAGAGLAGGSLALRLARSGARVALLDPARFPREKLCGEFLSPEAWEVLDRLGLTRDVERSGYEPIHRVRLTTPRARVLEAEFTGLDGLPGIGLGRSVLDNLLVQHARAAGVEILEEARVTGPVVHQGCVVGVQARGAGGGGPPFELRATVTVAAEGRHSSLVRQTGTTRTRSRFRPRLFGMKRHLNVPGAAAEPVGTVGLHLVPGGYGGTCRIEGGLTNLCALLPESALRTHRGQLDRLADNLFAANPALTRLWETCQPTGPWKTVAGVRVEASTPHLPGIFYTGDCQGTIDPLGGQGMTMALLGGETLAPFVTAALAVDASLVSLQRDYRAAWHRRFDRRILLCRLFHHILINPRMIDLASAFKTLAPKLLAAGFEQTRDRPAH